MTRIWPDKMLALKKFIDDYFAVEYIAPFFSDDCVLPTHWLKARFKTAKSIERIVLGKRGWEIYATFGCISENCPSCHGALAQHSWSKSVVLDAPLNKVHVRLHVRRPRLQCNKCNKTLTPVVPEVLESSRVTHNLVLHIQDNLLNEASIRSLAASVGASPKTITNVLKFIAEDSREQVAYPVVVGIHELSLNERRYLLISNLALGTVVDFVPSSENQVNLLGMQLIRFNLYQPTQVVSVPADREIVETTKCNCSSAQIELSFRALNTLIAQVVAKLGATTSRQGIIGSVSRIEVNRFAGLRRNEFSSEEVQRFVDGIHVNNHFWKLFEAKEQLLCAMESATSIKWYEIFCTWFHSLPLQWQASFHGLWVLLGRAQQLHVTLTPESRLPIFEDKIQALQRLLSKPGKSFSPEILEALLLAAPQMSIPLERRTGSKAAGPFWVEEPWESGGARVLRSAGISLENLVDYMAIHPARTKSNKLDVTIDNLWP
jgi:hypothetical protein